MGNLAGLQRRVLPHRNSTKVKEIPAIFPKRTDLPVHYPSVWFGHSPPRVYKGGQRSETQAHSTSKGYSDPSVPRRLITESPVPGNLPTTYPDPLGPLPRVRVGGKHEEVRIDSPAGLQFHRLLVRPIDRSGGLHSSRN